MNHTTTALASAGAKRAGLRCVHPARLHAGRHRKGAGALFLRFRLLSGKRRLRHGLRRAGRLVQRQSAALHTENDNQALPAVAFYHIPIPEVYDLFSEVSKDTEGAFKGVGVGSGKYYLPDYDKIFTGDVNESPCPSSENNGLFDAFVENGDVFLSVNGHDHINSFIGSLHGIDLASAPGSSYTSYGDTDVRGVRLFRFTEHCVKNYETIHVRYSDYNTPSSYGFLRYYFSTTTAIPNAAKVFVLLVICLRAGRSDRFDR
jgi:hypothetical protein